MCCADTEDMVAGGESRWSPCTESFFYVESAGLAAACIELMMLRHRSAYTRMWTSGGCALAAQQIDELTKLGTAGVVRFSLST